MLRAAHEADGSATIANAGHLPPYWNGAEVEVDSGLPLGIDAGAEYSETRFAVEEAGRIDAGVGRCGGGAVGSGRAVRI